jgi:hypothetical protein
MTCQKKGRNNKMPQHQGKAGGKKLNQGVLQGYFLFTSCAASAQKDIAENRDIFPYPDRSAAVGAS